MFSFTAYSIYYLTEIRYRTFYIFLNCFIINLYTFFYFNFFVMYLLKPLEYINIDLNTTVLAEYLQKTVDFIFFNEVVFTTVNNFRPFDFIPLLEININTNTSLYFYIFIYLFFIFTFPVILYQLYLFILPGLFFFEYVSLKKKIYFYILNLYFFFKFIIPYMIYFIFFLTFNNYYEFYNFEFDIEFNFSYYILTHIKILLLSYLTLIGFFFYFSRYAFFVKYIILIILFFLSPT